MKTLNIALVSFEYPLYTGYGGISSYIRDLAIMFTKNGNPVTIFCAGPVQEVRQPTQLLREHVIKTADKDSFAEELMPIFRKEHQNKPFDVIEAAEIYADARCIKKEFPSLPLVIKLHTSSSILARLNHMPIPLSTKIRFSLGALKRRQFRWLKADTRILRMRMEREAWIYRQADLVISPSRSLIDIAEEEWGKCPNGKSIKWLPNPYDPPSLLKQYSDHNLKPVGGFFGRLEKRKGFIVLIEALRLLENRGYRIPFHFIGSPCLFPGKAITMQQWALKRLRYHDLYTFTGHLQRSEAISELNKLDFVVLPSLWENFPYTCLEAMGQNKVVIGSASGGMADMIDDGVDGLLIRNPENAKEVAEKLIIVVNNFIEFSKLGKAARNKVVTLFSSNVILSSHLAVYQEAISSGANSSSEYN